MTNLHLGKTDGQVLNLKVTGNKAGRNGAGDERQARQEFLPLIPGCLGFWHRAFLLKVAVTAIAETA